MLDVAAALELVLAQAARRPIESSKPHLGRVLAEDIASDIDSPPFDKSVMDGYAVRSTDAAAGVALTVIEEVAAGQMPRLTVAAGQAIRVMTGAPIPGGADAVIPHEETEPTGEQVRLRSGAPAGQFVLRRAREMRAGEAVVSAGAVLNPATLGLLAAVGRTAVKTFMVPSVAVISTGDELVEADQAPGPGAIRNSNGPMLCALADRAGFEPRYLGIGRDNPENLSSLFRAAFAGSEVVITSGGVSAGKFDFVPGVLKDLGVETHFHKIQLKPGKPLLFGTLGDKLVFGLPGNPVSSFVGFELFIRPALRKMAGYTTPGPSFVALPLATDLQTQNDRPTYLPGRIESTPGGLRVRPGKWFGSADLRAMLPTDALIRVAPGDVQLPAATLVPTLLLNV